MSRTGVGSAGANFESVQRQVESKAMRKVEEGFQVLLIAETGASSDPAEIMFGLSMLTSRS